MIDLQKKMSDSENSENSDSDSGLDEERILKCREERERDEATTKFSFWMTENKLPLPIEHWYRSKRTLRSVLGTKHGGTGKFTLAKHRLDLLKEAAEYYVNIYGGFLQSVLAEMILYYK